MHFAHARYAGQPHVQWGSHACLYQAPETEWQPDDGMFGFMRRVFDWLGAAASGELDPAGLPLHPPAVYASASVLVVPRVDTPDVPWPWWAGYVRISREEDRWIELGEWIPSGSEVSGARVAPAILLPGGMPFEYPVTMAALDAALSALGVPTEVVRLLMTIGVLRAEAGKPLYFVLGAAMRGLSHGERAQHLACWRIDAPLADRLRAAALEVAPGSPVDAIMFDGWAAGAPISWCGVAEDRPEIVVRRDAGTPMSWWRGRHVALLGCGAIGSAAAMLLGRAGVARIQLWDKGTVTPGILVRQMFDRGQLGESKAAATRFNVRYANPDVEALPKNLDIVRALQRDDQWSSLLEADVVIDATASRTVSLALERRRLDGNTSLPALITLVIGRNADCGLMTYGPAGRTGAGYDLDRHAKLALSGDDAASALLDEFWPPGFASGRLFQPEPGCSDPTFRGSAADVLSLTGTMLNKAGMWLRGPALRRTFALRAPWLPAIVGGATAEYGSAADILVPETRLGYQIRLDPDARCMLLEFMRQSARSRGSRAETGGALFGEINDFLKVAWITKVGGPPADSVASRSRFDCGVEGVAEMHASLVDRTRGSVRFVGMWHTHPRGDPRPSPKDLSAMEALLGGRDFEARSFLMLIVGGTVHSPEMAGSLFKRSDTAPASRPFTTDQWHPRPPGEGQGES
jgi:integrative and conjugative element protein (TIGR02256 family)